MTPHVNDSAASTVRHRLAQLGGAARGLRLVVALVVLLPAAARGQTGENVAIVINEDSPVSQRVGAYYAERRAVPETNIIRIKAPLQESVSRADYTTAIEAPIARVLRQHALQDRILYIVLTKGVPHRLLGSEGPDGTAASVDSELTLLYRRMVGTDVPTAGRVNNPYYVTGPAPETHAFTHRSHDIYLVTRLDGFSERDVTELIDRAQTPSRQGRIVLDQRGGLRNNPLGDLWLAEAQRRLVAAGFSDRVQLENTTSPARDIRDVLGYYSWASNDPQMRARTTGMMFVPGAIAATFVSSDARTFDTPPDGWRPTGNWNDRSSWYAGAPQSLVGDMIREGVTGVAANVGDPFLQSAVRPDVLFPAYLSGLNLADSFYLAMPHLSWQTIVIGDPLCRPFAGATLTRADIEEALDAGTEHPALFAKRRIERLQATYRDAPEKALSLFMLSERREAEGDLAGARAALEQSTELAPALGVAQLQLGLLYEREGDHPRAQKRYEAVLAIQATNLVALNNLAYSIGVHRNSPAEARPLAERAYRLAPGVPTVADTFAWIEYLLGNHAAAGRLIAMAVKGTPDHAEFRLHAAFIYAALQQNAAAAAELTRALELNPDLRSRPGVKELGTQLAKSKGGGR